MTPDVHAALTQQEEKQMAEHYELQKQGQVWVLSYVIGGRKSRLAYLRDLELAIGRIDWPHLPLRVVEAKA